MDHLWPRPELGTGAGQRHWLGSGTSRRSGALQMAKSSNGMGPRLLYVLIVGTVIVASLALRVWDPTPVARLRSLVFDAYQRVSPRAFDPSLPVRIVDIDEDSLKAGGPVALAAHGAGRSRRQARRGWRRRNRLRHRVPRARPHVARQHAPLLAEIRGSGGAQRRGREASLQRPGLGRGDRQGSGCARLHRRAARNLRPRDQSRHRPWRRRSEAVCALLTPAPRRASRNCKTRRKGQALSTGSPSTIRSSAACPCSSGSATRSIPPLPPTCSGSPRAPRPIS